MKNWLNLNNNIPWENQPNTTEKSNPVYRYTDSPKQWEATGRLIFNCEKTLESMEVCTG